jgi:hypothetical protein
MLRWFVVLIWGIFVTSPGCSPALTKSGQPVEQALQELKQSLVDQPQSPLQVRLEAVLENGLTGRQLDSEVNAAWQIMHGVIAYGPQLLIKTPDRGLFSATEYAFSGGQLMGFELMPGNENLPATGRPGLKARLEPGSYIGQGHVDQWLAIFAMANLPLTTPVQVAGQQFTLVDWARQAQHDVTRNPLDEYSWTLIALTHYFPDEATWTAAERRSVSWEDLVDIELEYELDLSPCGGAHRLVGIARALQAKQRLGLADSPTWDKAQATVDLALQRIKEQRSAGGALSSFYFARPGTTADLSAELASSGHLLEVLAVAASAQEISAPWIDAAVMRLCYVLEQTREVELECGALYHALNGLKIYRDRRFLTSHEL